MSLLGTWLAKFAGAMGGAPAAGAIVVGGLIVGIVVGAGTGGGAHRWQPGAQRRPERDLPLPEHGAAAAHREVRAARLRHRQDRRRHVAPDPLRIGGSRRGVDPGERLRGPRVPRRHPRRELCARGAPRGRPVADRVDDGDRHLRADPGAQRRRRPPGRPRARRRAQRRARRPRPTPRPTPRATPKPTTEADTESATRHDTAPDATEPVAATGCPPCPTAPTRSVVQSPRSIRRSGVRSVTLHWTDQPASRITARR